MKKRAHNWIDFLTVFIPGLLIIIAGFYFAQNFIKPAPPREVTIASGQPEGAYYQFAHQYADYLAKEGIKLHVRETAGSVENIELLESGEVEIAFIQGGTVSKSDQGRLEGLGSLYYEPLWLFHNRELELDRLQHLESVRLAIGPEGSGTNALVSRLVAETHLDTNRLSLLALSTRETLSALEDGTVDAAFFVTRPGSPVIERLLRDHALEPASYERAAAYDRRFNYLSELTLPEGSQDLLNNVPDRDIKLLATTASLAVHPDIHPAIVDLIMQAASKAHRQGGWFEEEGEFPSPKHLELSLNEQAARYYKHGPPFLQRYLPFWAASMIDRLKVMLLPLIALMIPVFKLMPPLYRWKMRSRITRLYDELDELDPDERQLASLSKEEIRHRLNALEVLDQEAHDLKVPVAFSDRLYQLRYHIHLVRKSLLNTLNR